MPRRKRFRALRPDRILHGVRAVEDAALTAELADRGVCLDVCPTSNVALRVVDTLAVHPLPALLGAGVPCSLNVDNPLVFAVGVRDEYERARRVLGLADEELAAVARASLRAGAAPEAVRGPALAAVDTWLSSQDQ